jgi:hypothetical protein
MVTSPLPFPGTSRIVYIRPLLVMPCDDRSRHHAHQPLCLLPWGGVVYPVGMASFSAMHTFATDLPSSPSHSALEPP